MRTDLDWPAPALPDAVLAQVHARAHAIRRRRAVVRSGPAAVVALVLALAVGMNGSGAPQSLRIADDGVQVEAVEQAPADSLSAPSDGGPDTGAAGGSGAEDDSAAIGVGSDGRPRTADGGPSSPGGLPSVFPPPPTTSHLIEDPQGDELPAQPGLDLRHGDLANDASALHLAIGVTDVAAIPDRASYTFFFLYEGRDWSVVLSKTQQDPRWARVRISSWSYGVYECWSCTLVFDAAANEVRASVPYAEWNQNVDRVNAFGNEEPYLGPGGTFAQMTLTSAVWHEGTDAGVANSNVSVDPENPPMDRDRAEAPSGTTWTVS